VFDDVHPKNTTKSEEIVQNYYNNPRAHKTTTTT